MTALPTHPGDGGSGVHAGTRWDCLACETARRMALYGPCEGCGTARDARPAPRGSGLTYEFYCPGCGSTG